MSECWIIQHLNSFIIIYQKSHWTRAIHHLPIFLSPLLLPSCTSSPDFPWMRRGGLHETCSEKTQISLMMFDVSERNLSVLFQDTFPGNYLYIYIHAIRSVGKISDTPTYSNSIMWLPSKLRCWWKTRNTTKSEQGIAAVFLRIRWWANTTCQ